MSATPATWQEIVEIWLEIWLEDADCDADCIAMAVAALEEGGSVPAWGDVWLRVGDAAALLDERSKKLRDVALILDAMADKMLEGTRPQT